MSENDGGLPEESQGKLEQLNAVTINPRTPWKIDGRSVVQNYDDLIEFGQDLFSAARTERPTAKIATVIVIDNDSNTQHYPNNKQFWMGAYYKGQEDAGLIWKPFTEFFIGLRDAGNTKYLTTIQNTFIGRFKGVAVGSYQGIPIVVPDPNIDHTRPIVQAEATTSTTTGVTVITKTTADPRAAGVVTESETVPAAVTTPTELTAEQRKWLGNADPTDPYILARMRAATGSRSSQSAGPLASLLAQVKATTGVNPCLPNNPPASAGTSGSGATPPRAEPYQDAILRQARASAAAPASTVPATTARGGRGNGAAELAQRRADAATATATATAPTTVTQTSSTPTSTNQSAAGNPRPPSIYVYEPLTPGFDRYDFNTGKKVYTPDAGPSRNASSQPVVPQPTPRVPSNANTPAYTSSTVNNATTSAIAKGPDQTIDYSDGTGANTGGWKPPAYAITK
jgi:hypothetical protein